MYKLDFQMMQAHLAWIDGTADQHLFASFDDNKQRSKAKRSNPQLDAPVPQHVLSSLEERHVRDWMMQRQASGCHLGVTVNLFRGARRRAADLIACRVIYAELDGDALRPWPIPPTFIVRTSPGRIHAYWCLAEWVPRAIWEGIMRCIVLLYGADPATAEVTRVLRLAGSWHLKGNVAHLVTLEVVSGTRYSLAELVAAFPPVPKPPRVAKPALAPAALAGELAKVRQSMAGVPMVGYQDGTNISWIQPGGRIRAGRMRSEMGHVRAGTRQDDCQPALYRAEERHHPYG